MSKLNWGFGCTALLTTALTTWAATRPAEISFALHMIDTGAFETCAIADINRDGHPDIVSGENWYEGPNWIKHPSAPSSITATPPRISRIWCST
jgi:hypothetical protein